MSVNMKTKLTITGSSDELAALMKVLRTYTVEYHEQFDRSHNCCYLTKVRVHKGRQEIRIAEMKDIELKELAESIGSTLEITANGPFGAFCDLTEVTLFEDMSVAAPSASFQGESVGEITPVMLSCQGRLEGGMLHLSAYSQSEMQWASGVENEELHALFDPKSKAYTQL